MTDKKQVIIIGAGHNGLVCAAYLARSGRKVLVLEAADRVGGAAVTREFAPGFSVSACAHLLHLLNPRVMRELQLEKHGLEFAASNIGTISLSPDGPPLLINGDSVSGGDATESDQTALPAFLKRMGKFARLLETYFSKTPPRFTPEWSNLKTMASLGLDMRFMGREDMRELMRVIGINIYDVVQEQFDSEMLKAAMGFDAVLGTHLGPRSPNSMLTWLYRLTGSVAGQRGALAIPKGGIGAVSCAIASAAEAQGVEIRNNAPVARILLDEGKVSGVELKDGEKLEAGLVVSNADPKTTIFDLLGARNVEAGFAHAVLHIRTRGNAAKLHLALDRLPEFRGVDAKDLGNRLLIAPTLDYVELAFNHAKYGEYSSAPAIEITLPTVHDSTLAPAGKHVLSAVVQYAPYDLKEGWENARDAFTELVIDTMSAYAPDLRDCIAAREMLTPLDLEQQFRMTGGHWHHGEFALDRFLMLRPVPEAAQYATPVAGLYLCGAGCHPGGGVMGSAGRNAANELNAREKAA